MPDPPCVIAMILRVELSGPLRRRAKDPVSQVLGEAGRQDAQYQTKETIDNPAA
jgi:hypothetical protein